MPSAAPTASQRRYMPAWVTGILYGGTYNGFAAVSLSQLMPEHGVSLERTAEMITLILTASYVSFLLTPLVDCALPRRVWAGLLAIAAAACLCFSVPMLRAASENEGHGPHATALILVLFFGYLCNQMYTSTIGGMVPNLVRPSQHSAASAWLNISYLALTGAGGAICVWEVRNLPVGIAMFTVPIPILLCATPLFFIPKEDRAPRRVGEAMRKLFSDLWETARQPSYLFALLVFVIPSATFALQNLFGGMGADFHASPELTNLSVGLLFTIACAIGAAIGGPLSNRFDRRFLFIAPAMLAALGSLAMAFGPKTPWVFAAGLFFYNLMAGINYTATSALVFQIVGKNNPLSATQYAVSIAACNLAIAGSVFTDGKGAGRFGVRGALITDALLSLVLGSLVLLLVWKFGGGFPKPPIGEDELAEAVAGAKAT
ncbi:MFS transporter [Terriglobus sp. RCC_193]|uniref:MFS transporter n=1 Tax=Terriglobus sp. RCC_193 TaxID=3239218 RepID=UPI003523E12C